MERLGDEQVECCSGTAVGPALASASAVGAAVTPTGGGAGAACLSELQAVTTAAVSAIISGNLNDLTAPSPCRRNVPEVMNSRQPVPITASATGTSSDRELDDKVVDDGQRSPAGPAAGASGRLRPLGGGASLLVLAAWEGQRELDQALEGSVTGAHPLRPTPARVGPPRTYLKS